MPSRAAVAGFALGAYPGRRLLVPPPVYTPPIPSAATNPEEVFFTDRAPAALVGPINFTTRTNGTPPQPPPVVSFQATATVTKDATPGGVSLAIYVDGAFYGQVSPSIIFNADQTMQLQFNGQVFLPSLGAHSIELFIEGDAGFGGGHVLQNQAYMIINYT